MHDASPSDSFQAQRDASTQNRFTQNRVMKRRYVDNDQLAMAAEDGESVTVRRLAGRRVRTVPAVSDA